MLLQSPFIMDQREFLVDFHLIPFHGSDFFLGFQLLRRLRPTLFDYEILYMSFNHGSERITITGLHKGIPTQISMAQLSHEVHQGGIGHLYQLELNLIVPEQPPSSY